MNKSAVVQKINLGQVGQAVQASSGSRNVSGQVDVQIVNTTIQVVNPNGVSDCYLNCTSVMLMGFRRHKLQRPDNLPG